MDVRTVEQRLGQEAKRDYCGRALGGLGIHHSACKTTPRRREGKAVVGRTPANFGFSHVDHSFL